MNIPENGLQVRVVCTRQQSQIRLYLQGGGIAQSTAQVTSHRHMWVQVHFLEHLQRDADAGISRVPSQGKDFILDVSICGRSHYNWN